MRAVGLARWTLALEGVATALLLGRDGSLGARVAGVAAAITISALALIGTRRHGRVHSWTMLAAGLVGIVLGTGIGMPHATRVGFGLAACAGLTCLATGLALTAVGGIRLVRGMRGWRRVFAPPVAAALAILVVLPMTLAVTVTNTPGRALEAATPSDHDLTYREVSFTTADHVVLRGWYVPSTNGAAVVLMHGSGSTRSAVLDHAVVLARHGYGVLLYDSRGNGESDGRAMGLGWYGDLDTSAAVSFLARQPDLDPSRIGAVGLSMGGEQAIGAAGSDPRIAAVVAEGATGRVRADNTWQGNDPAGWLTSGFDLVAYTATDLLTDADPPSTLRSSVAAAAPHRVLVIAAAGEIEAGRHIRAGSPDTVDLWELPDTGHTGGLDTHPRAWERRVIDFLDATLA